MSQGPVTIWHNPACGTSRNVLAFIREAGIEPTIIEYLKAPPDRATLTQLLREKGTRLCRPSETVKELLDH